MKDMLLKDIKQESLKLGATTRAVILVTLDHDGKCDVRSVYNSKPDLVFCERVIGMHVAAEMVKEQVND